jgi:DNA-binding response OmpR family regulator
VERRSVDPIPGDLLELELAGLHVAVVDRDRAFLRALAAHMRALGWRLTVHPGAASPSALDALAPHAVLVDVAVLGRRWDDWLTRHMERIPHVGLIVCTEGSTLKQRIRGLVVGADDWITKPCAVEEVAARIFAVVRAHRMRMRREATAPVFSVGLEVRPDLYDAFVDGKAAQLTRREFDVLLCLARGQGEVVSRERVYREVWSRPNPGSDRALDTCIRKIRAKLRALAPERRYVHTHWGVGYRFAYERARPRCEDDVGRTRVGRP